MSAVQDVPTPIAGEPPAGRRRRAGGRRGRGRWTKRRAVVTSAALAAGMVASGFVALLLRDPGVPTGSPTAPITLPKTVAGLSAQNEEQDAVRSKVWRRQAAQAVGEVTVEGRTFGPSSSGRTIRIVTARADLTGRLELGWAADEGDKTGIARCTNNVVVAPGSPPRVRPTLMLCWRTSPTFSAYSLIIDPRSTMPVTGRAGEAALREAWRAAVDGA